MIRLKKRYRDLAVVIMGLGILCISHSLFGEVRNMSTKELVNKSTAVVTGRCVEKNCYWNDKHTQIFTKIKIRAEEYVKGNLGSEIELTIPGGRVGNILYEVSDMPLFDNGEEVFLFIWQHPSGKNLVTGAFQGKLQVRTDKKTGEKTVPVIPLKLNQKGDTEPPSSIPTQRPSMVMLRDFVKMIKSYMSEK